jgi:hypothetical protein
VAVVRPREPYLLSRLTSLGRRLLAFCRNSALLNELQDVSHLHIFAAVEQRIGRNGTIRTSALELEVRKAERVGGLLIGNQLIFIWKFHDISPREYVKALANGNTRTPLSQFS